MKIFDLKKHSAISANFSDKKLDNSRLTEDYDISVFINNSSQKELTKDEIKAQKKLERAMEKAEKKRITNVPDGIIQGAKQGSEAGDCWLLAQINSLSRTDWGKDILKNAINTDDEGNYVVHFKGVKEDIKINKEDFKRIQGNTKYSSGDADVLLYEIAVERYFKKSGLNNGTIKGNDLAGMDSLNYLLTGSMGKQFSNIDRMEPILKAMGGNTKNNNGISATYIYKDTSPDNVKDSNHAISIQKVILDENGNIDKVVVLDSYHPDRQQTLSYKAFKNNVILFGYISEPQDKK